MWGNLSQTSKHAIFSLALLAGALLPEPSDAAREAGSAPPRTNGTGMCDSMSGERDNFLIKGLAHDKKAGDKEKRHQRECSGSNGSKPACNRIKNEIQGHARDRDKDWTRASEVGRAMESIKCKNNDGTDFRETDPPDTPQGHGCRASWEGWLRGDRTKFCNG